MRTAEEIKKEIDSKQLELKALRSELFEANFSRDLELKNIVKHIFDDSAEQLGHSCTRGDFMRIEGRFTPYDLAKALKDLGFEKTEYTRQTQFWKVGDLFISPECDDFTREYTRQSMSILCGRR